MKLQAFIKILPKKLVTAYLCLENIFVKFLQIRSFIIDCYELRSYERGVAQLGSAGALGACLFTNETYCNN